jgi:hypothetical protein
MLAPDPCRVLRILRVLFSKKYYRMEEGLEGSWIATQEYPVVPRYRR